MPRYEITSPEGRKFEINAPDGATQDQVLAYAQSNFNMPSKAALDTQKFNATLNPTIGMSGTQRFLSGAGKAFSDIGRGVGQIAGITPESQIAESRRLDAPLMKTGTGISGNIAGGMAALAPTLLIPGVNTYTGAALVGGLYGALQPIVGDESRAANAGLGAVGGIVGQGLGNVMGRILKPVASSLSPEEQVLAKAAAKNNIPLTVGQQTGSKPLRITESVMENLPLTSGPQLAAKEAQQQAFNRAVLSRAGIDSSVATPGVLANQKALIGGELGKIAEGNKLNFNNGLTDKLSEIVSDAATHLPPKKAAEISGVVNGILSQVGKDGSMPGTNYQGWREPLRGLATNTEYGRYFGQIRSALDNAFKSQITGSEGDAFRSLSQKYANVKTIADAMGGAGAGTKIGNISPAQLEQALTKSVGREGKALGRGDLNQLVGVGRKFVSESIPDSGTAQRQFYTNLLTGQVAGALPGAGLGYYSTGTKEGALTGGLAGSALALGLPRATQALIQNPAVKAYLTKGIIPLSQSGREALSTAARLGILSAQPAAQQAMQ